MVQAKSEPKIFLSLNFGLCLTDSEPVIVLNVYYCDISVFQCSEGNAASFSDGLKVGVYSEIVPMGIDPAKCSPLNGGELLNLAQK